MSTTGVAYRVYCDECDVETIVGGELSAEDLIDRHEEYANCDAADVEEVDDA